MTFFCWILPGVAFIGAAYLAFVASYFTSYNTDLVQLALLFAFLIILVASGIFASILKITAENGRECVTPRSVAFKTFIFCILQILVAPAVVLSIGLGCIFFS